MTAKMQFRDGKVKWDSMEKQFNSSGIFSQDFIIADSSRVDRIQF